MKRTSYLSLLFLLMGVLITSCSDEETYAEQKEKERNAISYFVNRDVTIRASDGTVVAKVGRINVISEGQFYAQGMRTLTEANQYVLFNNSGVYMQIVREGEGEKIKSGESRRVICRYMEFNILRDSIQTRNDVPYWSTRPDIMDVSNNYGTFTASFNTALYGGGAMYSYYGTTAVPSGWLVPLTYINMGRWTSEEAVAKVRLIVPHTSGHSDASSNVYPCFYEISYMEMRD